MRPQNTRWVPTTDGPIHAGHAYMALVNEYEAHSTGGKFTVRFDDNQEFWLHKLGSKFTAEICNGMQEDLTWLGIKVDDWQYQSEREPFMQALYNTLIGTDEEYQNWGNLQFFHDFLPETPADPAMPYCYAPTLTAEKVIYDFMEHTNLLIRGNDLLNEFALYAYFCEMWGLPQSRHVYLPRLTVNGSEAVQPTVGIVSKTHGNWKIKDLRERGMEADEVLNLLRESCLKDPGGKWSIENVSINPTILTKRGER